MDFSQLDYNELPNNIVGFYGYMGGAWNLDALKILIERVIPEVHKKKPDTILKVTGTNIPKEIR